MQKSNLKKNKLIFNLGEYKIILEKESIYDSNFLCGRHKIIFRYLKNILQKTPYMFIFVFYTIAMNTGLLPYYPVREAEILMKGAVVHDKRSIKYQS